MKKLIVVTENYWPQGGGAELATHLTLSKIKDVFDVTVVTGAKTPEFLKGVKYVYLPYLDVNNKIQLWINLLIKKDYIKDLVEQCDVVYIPRLAYPIVDVARRCGKRVVVHLHDYQPLSFEADVSYPFEATYQQSLLSDMKKSFKTEFLKDNDFQSAFLSMVLTPINRMTKFWVSMADEIICVSKRQSEIFKTAMPEISGKLKIVYNPLPNISYVPKTLNDCVFLYIGGNQYIKGIHTLIKASIALSNKEKAKYILTKITKNTWKTFFTKLNIKFNNAYTIVERINYSELLDKHEKTSALILPSIWEEPLPYAALESMLAGTILIASRVGGIPEIVEGTFAEKMLFTPGNVDELVEKMEWILALSSEERISKGKKLRADTLRKFGHLDHRKLFLEIIS